MGPTVEPGLNLRAIFLSVALSLYNVGYVVQAVKRFTYCAKHRESDVPRLPVVLAMPDHIIIEKQLVRKPVQNIASRVKGQYPIGFGNIIANHAIR